MYSSGQLISWIPRLKRNGPLNVKTIKQGLKRNRCLDAQGIEQILKRNGLLKDNDFGRVLDVLARRKELRLLKGMSYPYKYMYM